MKSSILNRIKAMELPTGSKKYLICREPGDEARHRQAPGFDARTSIFIIIQREDRLPSGTACK
jgi:DNA topoisomerase IB